MIVTEAMVDAALTTWKGQEELAEYAGNEVRMEAAILAALTASPGWLTKEELVALRDVARVEWHSPLLESAIAKIDGLVGR